jgi:predicted Zn-dependent protease
VHRSVKPTFALETTTNVPEKRQALPDRAGYFYGKMQALDELVARWRKNPDSESTLALCAHLGRSQQSELMREVGNTAEAWHRENASVMLSVGRMYLDAGLLAEGQAAFVQAGKLVPSDSAPYRYLGEVLLRRGDAVRGEKALARALKLGGQDAETRLWHERAVLYSGLQQRKGLSAVAEQVARVLPKEQSIPAPTLSPFDDPLSEAAPAPAAPRGERRSRPPAGPARPTGPRRSSPPGAQRRRASRPPEAAAVPEAVKAAPQNTLMMGRSPVPMPVPGMPAPAHPPSPFHRSDSHSPRARVGQPLGTKLPNLLPKELPERKLAATTRNPALAEPAQKRFFPDSVPAPPAPPVPEPAAEPFVVSRPKKAPSHVFAPSQPAQELGDVEVPSEATHTDLHAVQSSPRSAVAAVPHAPTSTVDAQASPEDVLQALAQVGLFEITGGVVPAWEAPVPAAPRRVWTLAAAVLVAASAGFGGYRYANSVKSDRLAQAQAIGAHLATLLDSGSKRDLAATESEFQRLFELDSRGQEAALLWLKNRALHTLIADESAPGIESALERARSVGLEEPRLVFGRIASALSAGDLPGAAQLVTLWDQRAKDDALYQLFVGALFERAGNPQALERFQSAVALQPDLDLAHLMAARLALLQLGPEKAKSTLDVASAHLGPGPAEQILRGLAWASTAAGTGPTPEAPSEEALRELPPFLRSTAHAVEAVRAHREGRFEQVNAAFQRALGPATEPALAAWIGYQALDAGDVQTARSAALKAMEMSALHQDSEALAARIALADGRLKEARDAGRGLDPRSRDALLLEIVSAYEGLQATDLTRLGAELPADARSGSNLLALRDSSKVMLGQLRAKPDVVKQLGNHAQVWGPLVALDLALDAGQLESAERLLQTHQKSADALSYATRAARLHRYQGRSEAALDRIHILLDQTSGSPRAAAEAVLGLLDAGRASAAASTLERMGDDAGTLTPWLGALVDAAQGRGKVAAKLLVGRPLPGKNAPVLLQTVALRSLVAVKDRRAKAYGNELKRRIPNHPELKLAGR